MTITEPQDEQRYDIEMNDGTIVKNVEYWAFGGGFQPSAKHMGTSHLVEYRLKDVASFSLANKTSKELRYNNSMHNVSVGDIFTSSTEVYRVVEVLENEECPDDPLFVVELLVSGSGFVLDDISFTLAQAEKYNLQHYKATK